MKTLSILLVALAVTFSGAMGAETKQDKSLGEKTAETLKKAGEKTKDAGRSMINATKKATDAVVDAVTPDKDARKVDVTLAEHRIELPKNLESGKTAFIVRNTGTRNHNFEIRGQGIEKSFFADLSPDETKVLHVDLKPGTYKVFSPGKDGAEHGTTSELTVR
jgi:hypothetical protein